MLNDKDLLKKIHLLRERYENPDDMFIEEDEYLDDDEEMSEDDYLIEELTEKYGERFYNVKLEDEHKNGKPKYSGRNIDWYGLPGESVIVPVENVITLEGNIFDDNKQDYLIELIERSEERVELYPGYVYISKVDLSDVIEATLEEYEDGLSTATTGSEELDKYLRSSGEVQEHLYPGSYEVNDFFETVHTTYCRGFKTREEILRMFEEACQVASEDEDFVLEDAKATLLDFFEKEESVIEHVENGWGTIGEFEFQMRDGNHRFTCAKLSGEENVLVIIGESNYDNNPNIKQDLIDAGYDII